MTWINPGSIHPKFGFGHLKATWSTGHAASSSLRSLSDESDS
ncbi:hypothetical protein SynBIOSE41_03923 [Synechococcus sp. BIOS-E4-1]|nr:hypothetical protein SynBIOSE41_03923 [Synechococcus sp. BIOS-E4-1]